MTRLLCLAATVVVSSCSEPSLSNPDASRPESRAAANATEPAVPTPGRSPVAVLAPQAEAEAVTLQRREDQWAAAWFICDGVDAPIVHVVERPGADELATVWSYRKSDFVTSRRAVRVGAADPGMSQVNYALSDPESGRVVGALRAFSPGVLERPVAATTPTFSSVTLGDASTSCRWQAGTRLLAFTQRRSIQVRQEADGTLVYESFDFRAPVEPATSDVGRTTRPSLTIRGGRETVSRGVTQFRFANAGVEYRLTASPLEGAPGASFAVARGTKVEQVDTAAAYTLARTPPSTRAALEVAYECTDGRSLTVRFDNARDEASVTLAGGGAAVTLASERPGSGLWYRGGGYELTGRGREVVLVGPDGARRECRS